MDEGIKLPRRGFVWHELMSTDPKQSEEFYLRVAGVSVTPLGEGPEAYLMLTVGGQPVGGLARPRPGQEGWPSGGPEAHWIAYFGTDDVAAFSGDLRCQVGPAWLAQALISLGPTRDLVFL